MLFFLIIIALPHPQPSTPLKKCHDPWCPKLTLIMSTTVETGEYNLLSAVPHIEGCSCKSVSVHSTRLQLQTQIYQYKIALTCFHIISSTAPPYLSELLHLYSPSRSLRSDSDTRILRVPRVCRRTLGEKYFQYIGPVIWNSLPFSVRHAKRLSSFKSKLKTHLFSSAC